MTTVRLNEEMLNKISVLEKLENATKSEIIKRAITEYYKKQIMHTTPYETGVDLFGKYGSFNVQSEDYKTRLKEKLSEKHSH
jgi:predicted transcriptional regulator